MSVSPFDTQAISFGWLDNGFGKSPFIIREIPLTENKESWMPFLIALSPQTVKGVNLLTGSTRKFFTAPADEQILSNFVERYITLESDGQTIFFMKKRDDQAFLQAYDVFNQSGKEFPLPNEDFTGPFKIGDQIGIYSKNRLYVLKGDQIQPQLEFGNFQAWVSPDEVRDFQPHFGRMPFLVRRDSIYIPGTRGTEPGFLFVSLRNPTPVFAFISSQGEATYTQDAEGRPLVARNGEVIAYEGTTASTIRSDNQLTAKGLAYYNDPLAIGFTRTAGGVESLRFYYNGHISDYSLAQLQGFIDVGFFSIAETLMFCYLIERDNASRLGIKIWDI